MKKPSLIALLQLTEVPGLGPTRIRSLVHFFKNPESIFGTSLKGLCQVDRIDMKLAQNIIHFLPTSFAHDQIKKAKEQGVQILTFWDKDYPILLKKIYDPPLFLFIKGSLIKRDRDSLAIVGTRNPTSYGKKMAHDLSEGLASAGLTIVSGFARGIDTQAHKAAVSIGGRTIAVLGSGLDIIYPSENRHLFSQVEEHGALISEFPFGTQPDAGNFPQRNRIISGLSHGVIVIEAGNRSGSLLTAFNAVDQNRDVFAVPGRLIDKMSTGCLRLIRHGAIPVESTQQILEIVNPQLMYPMKPIQSQLRLDLTADEVALYSVLSDEPKQIDEIVEEAKQDPSTVLTLLLSLELKGVVTQLSGKQFVKS